MRDSSYEFTETSKILVDEDEELPSLPDNEKMAYNLGKWLTVGLMRAGRQV